MSNKLYDETLQIFLGCEQIFPENQMIPLVRFYVEKFTHTQFSKEETLGDLFKIIKQLGDYPVTASLENFILSDEPKEQLIALMSLVELLTYND